MLGDITNIAINNLTYLNIALNDQLDTTTFLLNLDEISAQLDGSLIISGMSVDN